MSSMSSNQPIIIKRRKKVHHDEPHVGNWKVAYADFTTAMMAFFLIMWLLNATTEEQMMGIADYFSPTVLSQSLGGAGGVLGGNSLLSPGSMRTSMSQAGVTVSRLPLSESEDPDEEGLPAEKPPDEASAEEAPGKFDDASAEEARRKLEAQEFERAKTALREAIEASPELRAFSENLLIDMTAEGMRIQIADAEQRSMFPLGSSAMYPHTERLLQKVVQAVARLPNDIAVVGHTDATPYRSDEGYTNWELSSDRANASRRTLVAAGLPTSRIVRVSGKADHYPLVADDPFSPQNRRISILLLRDPVARQGGQQPLR